MADIAESNRPFKVFSVLGTSEGFYSGHMTKDEADIRCASANAEAVKLGIKTRYKVFSTTISTEKNTVESTEAPANEQQ